MNTKDMVLKVVAVREEKRWELGIPFTIESDGYPTITLEQAIGAAELLRSEAYPEAR